MVWCMTVAVMVEVVTAEVSAAVMEPRPTLGSERKRGATSRAAAL